MTPGFEDLRPVANHTVIVTAFVVLIVCLATLSHLLGRALSLAAVALVRSAYRHSRQGR